VLASSHASAAAEPPPVQGEAVVAQTPGELDQLVAPIALYPDELVAQVLGACTYPTEIVEADRWIQEHSGLKGHELAQAVDQQPWDPSIKGLTQFPSVLANLDKNLSWASALGDAYVNQQQAVLDAVQEMRRRAQQQGNLKSTSAQTVSAEGSTIVIQPSAPEIVYVPTYDPWLVYGAPLVPYPGWYWYPGLYARVPGITFGLGFGIGLFAGFGWGWHHWGADWHGHQIIHNHDPYFSHSRTFVDRNHFYRGGPGFPGRPGFHGGGVAGFHGPGGAGFHGGGVPHAGPGIHSGAFSGFDHGPVSRGFSGRGASSAGGHLGGGFAGHGFGGGHR
jgi:hypothetical protein